VQVAHRQPLERQICRQDNRLVFNGLQYLSHFKCNQLQRSKRDGLIAMQAPFPHPEKWRKLALVRRNEAIFFPSPSAWHLFPSAAATLVLQLLKQSVAPLRFKAPLPPRRMNA